jgi:hypothetical protein
MHLMDFVLGAACLSGASALLTFFRLVKPENEALPVIAKAFMALAVSFVLVGVLMFGNDVSNGISNIGKDTGSFTVPTDTTPETTIWDSCDPTSPAWNPDATNC